MVKKILLILALRAFVSQMAFAEEKGMDLYPELPIAKEYRELANHMTDLLIKHLPDAAGKKNEILSFIFSRKSVNDFEEEIISGYKLLKKGHTDLTLQASPEYQEEKDGCKSICRMMAIIEVSHAHDVYYRKILRPNDMTAPLFAMSTDPETDLIISWIEKEVTEAEFHEKSPKPESLLIQPGDKFFFYNSPPFSWGLLFGRAGYAVFRNGKLIENVLTRMN